jgi:hypothetical protein
MECRSCGKTEFKEIIDLGLSPWCNNFLTKEQVGLEEKYPLKLIACTYCHLVQLDYTVKKEIMFKDHTYVSGTTSTLAKHFLTLAKENKRQFNLNRKDFIVDIGGNDGTQLIQYRQIGFVNVLNVESADNIARISQSKLIDTINDFFNEELVDSWNGAKAMLINASGVFFHLEELHSVCRGVKKLLDDNGVFVVQFMYFKDMVDHLAFDAIYHEHLCYYTLQSLMSLLKQYDLILIDAYPSPIHGGSMMTKFVHAQSYHNPTDRAKQAVYNEFAGLNDTKIQEFVNKVESKKDSVREFLIDLKKQGKKIYGYGSPAKGTTLLNYFKIDNTILDKIVEINELKVGLYTPGTHIPIVKESKEDLPDYYFLLAWNFADEIIAKNQDIIAKGVKFITPFPEIKIIDSI